jgi:uncharacterized membrane protein (Fun14 family)
MISTDIAPFAGTVGGGFFLGLLAGYAIRKVIKIAAVIFGLFIAALAYLEYQRILAVDWSRIQALSQNSVTWITDAIGHISSTIGAPHAGAISNVGIPFLTSASAGMTIGLFRA